MRVNKKFLYVIGCSWSAKGGNPYHDLHGESREEKIEFEDKLKWQRLLSDKLNLELINDAVVGGSNDMSIKKLRNFILHDERAKNSIIIWQWTDLSRFMVYSDDQNVFVQPGYLGSIGKEIEVHKNRIDKYTYSDTIQSYDLIEETAIISELCENRNIKFIVFDGNAYVKSILDKVVFNSSESLYNSIFYRPIIVDQLYHDKKVSLYESLIDDGIIIKPHGYFSWRESLENHSQLDREKIEGAYVGEKFDGFDFHPGYDAALLFSNFLYEMINEL